MYNELLGIFRVFIAFQETVVCGKEFLKEVMHIAPPHHTPPTPPHTVSFSAVRFSDNTSI